MECPIGGPRCSEGYAKGNPGDNSDSIVLNLMQPQAAGRQRVGFGGEARRDGAGRKSTRTGKHDVRINRQRWPRLEGWPRWRNRQP